MGLGILLTKPVSHEGTKTGYSLPEKSQRHRYGVPSEGTGETSLTARVSRGQ